MNIKRLLCLILLCPAIAALSACNAGKPRVSAPGAPSSATLGSSSAASSSQGAAASGDAVSSPAVKLTIKYTNTKYGFYFYLPDDWKGYKAIEDVWKSSGGKTRETGPVIKFRSPEWTEQDPHEDIPIMIFTIKQWDAVQKEEIVVGAAPAPPREMARNSKYVFALRPRWDFDNRTGVKEAEAIVGGNPLEPIGKVPSPPEPVR